MAKTLDVLIEEYSASHRNPVNITVHRFCVPAIMWSLLGLLSVIKLGSGVNAAHIFSFFSIIYYLQFKNLRVILIMLVSALVMIWSFNFVTYPLWTSLGVFVVAWIAQFYGHAVEGKRPSFLKDLQFILIGPIWTLQEISPVLVGLDK